MEREDLESHESKGKHQLHELDQLIKKSRRLIDELEFLLDEPNGTHRPAKFPQSSAVPEQDLRILGDFRSD